MGIYQAAKGQYASSATENLWNAYSASRTLRQPFVTTALVGIGLYQALNGKLFAPAVSLLYYALSARQLATGETQQPAD